jgi:hypothetical protein
MPVLLVVATLKARPFSTPCRKIRPSSRYSFLIAVDLF